MGSRRGFEEETRKKDMYIHLYLDIPLPGAEGREKMFHINMKALKVSNSINWQRIVQVT